MTELSSTSNFRRTLRGGVRNEIDVVGGICAPIFRQLDLNTEKARFLNIRYTKKSVFQSSVNSPKTFIWVKRVNTNVEFRREKHFEYLSYLFYETEGKKNKVIPYTT